MNSVPAEIDTGLPKSRKAPPKLITLGRGRSLDAFPTNRLLARLKSSGKCFRCRFPAFARRPFIGMPRKGSAIVSLRGSFLLNA